MTPEPERLRLWLERGGSGYWLRDAASGEPVRWRDERLLVVAVAGASYRLEALQDPSFAPGSPLALVPEPENRHDPDAIGIWDAGRRLQAGYVPADETGRVPPAAQAVSLWECRDDGGRRVGLRVLIAPAEAWIGRPRA
ncbi:MAG TPA: HIRAN domain-containing protein [Gaiellaceae bacterium]|nr:HIRAN domain-containing protein [Gaiellaceae bacterium]